MDLLASRSSWILLILLSLQCRIFLSISDPTDGFTPVPLSDSNFKIQHPYDIPVNERYSYIDGIHRLWVYSTDKPHDPTSQTNPRTEIRIRGYDYSWGIWQFEGYGFVPNGTSGVAIAQIHGAVTRATTIMLRVYNGDLKYYSQDVLASNIYGKWLRINIIHDVGAGKVSVFIDGVQKIEKNDHGRSEFYFKCGVYAQDTPSYYMESQWRDIKLLKKYI